MTTSSSSCGEAPAKAVLAIDREQTAAVVLFASAEYARDWTRIGCRAALARRCGSGRSETAGVGLGLAVCRSLKKSAAAIQDESHRLAPAVA